MNQDKQKLTLDRPATYQIKVPGHIDESWSDWFGEMMLAVESEGAGHHPDRRPQNTLGGGSAT